ncbi:MAG: hypothetical protein E5X65_34740 [Mesorhizobium sp.]|nr:MAG: hypothetical protein E5X65_34740 [Mesorhizobium sp.]
MILLRVFRKLRDPDQPKSYFEAWLGNAKAVHEFIFVTIESLIVLGALHLAWEKSGSLLVLLLYCLAYVGAFLFIGTYIRFGFHAAADHFDLPDRYRGSFLWFSGIVSFAVSMALPYFFGMVVNQIIANSIMI